MDWAILSFDIYFGGHPPPAPALKWSEFTNILRQNGPDGTTSDPNAPALPAPETDQVTGQYLHNFVATTGLLVDPNDMSNGTKSDSKATWMIDGTIFSYCFNSLFPINSMTYIDTDTTSDSYTSNATYMKPMHIGKGTQVTSDLTLTTSFVSTADVPNGSPPNFEYSQIIKKAPTALWGACKFLSLESWI